jgi:hypothetical protein
MTCICNSVALEPLYNEDVLRLFRQRRIQPIHHFIASCDNWVRHPFELLLCLVGVGVVFDKIIYSLQTCDLFISIALGPHLVNLLIHVAEQDASWKPIASILINNTICRGRLAHLPLLR